MYLPVGLKLGCEGLINIIMIVAFFYFIFKRIKTFALIHKTDLFHAYIVVFKYIRGVNYVNSNRSRPRR